MTMFRSFVVLLLFAASSAASAQTMSFEAAIAILSSSCGKDIDAYCKGVNLGAGRIKNCLARNQAKVSAQCQSDFARVEGLVQKRADARIAVLKICDADIRKLCGMVQAGDGQILDCMLTAQKGTSPKCNQAITDAGYR